MGAGSVTRSTLTSPAPTDPPPPRPYRAYLLRLWQVQCEDQLVWRASLENPHTGERQGFADLARLYEFLKEQTDEPSRPPIE